MPIWKYYKKREWGTNTQLARRLARLYEKAYDKPFPGGIDNACIDRDYKGVACRHMGSVVWALKSIRHDLQMDVREFGGGMAATICVKEHKYIEAPFGYYPYE